MQSILLSGFMGAGKSAAGRLLAQRLGLDWLDLDAEVERRSGATVSDIFRDRGERGFRELERDCLLDVLSLPGARVVSLGGGALLDRSTRLEALARARVFHLGVTASTAFARARAAPRPLLASATDAARLLAERREAYAECHSSVDAEAPLATVVDGLAALAERRLVAVAAGLQSYCVEVGSGVIPARAGALLADATSALVVSDHTVAALHGDSVLRALRAHGPDVGLWCMPPGERSKCSQNLFDLWQELKALRVDRRGRVLALGGGVVSDLAGFAASTWQRGVAWAAMPTTLLAAVDASVGGKTAIDLGEAKNAVGTFWQPSSVVCDVSLLATEPQSGFVAGLAEVVKSALIGDPALFSLLESDPDGVLARSPELVAELVERSVRVKASIVSRDVRESGERRLLNLGHTVGHALEAAEGYGLLSHGAAVSLGMVLALELGVRLRVTAPELVSRVEHLLRALGLPTRAEPVAIDRALHLLEHDKKREGDAIRFVLVHDIGDVRVHPLAVADLPALLAP